MKLDITISEAQELIHKLTDRETFMEAIRVDVPEAVGKLMSNPMDGELTWHLGRRRYKRIKGTCDHRNGKYSRKLTLQGIGEVNLAVPRDRMGAHRTRVIAKWQRYERALVDDRSPMFLSGCSTRSLSLISKRLIGRSISSSEISNATRELSVAVEQWRLRDLSQEPIKYLYLDGVNFNMRLSDGIAKVPVFMIFRVPLNGQKEEFVKKWEKDIPSAVKCLQSSVKACLTYMDFPEEEWISLRTTNVIERLNKEFKRKTKPMEIVPGEESCYRLLAFISLTMELQWRANLVGKVRENPTFSREIKEI